MISQHCNHCNTDHPLESKYWRIRGNYYQCKVRIRLKHKKWVTDNKDRVKELAKSHYTAHKDKIIKRNYIYTKSRRKVDLNYNLSILLRQRFNKALKGQYKAGSAVKALGCSLPEFKLYLESKFQPGMTWDNYGRTGWHIDHVVPISKFNLSDPQQVKLACNFNNLQPLWAEDNLTKGSKILPIRKV